jgi:choline dehydrogenase-like flavoprotein
VVPGAEAQPLQRHAGRSHEVPNLGILGGSTFPSSAGRNPTETIQATSWRTAEYVAQNFSSITD